MGLGYDDFVSAVADQARLLAAHLDGADLTTAVPTCPGWNVGQLARHVGGAHRWTEAILRAAGQPVPQDVAGDWRGLGDYADEDPAVVGPWLVEGADRLAGALADAGPGALIWSPVPGSAQTSDFHARRMTHETALHRADAALALGVPYTLGPAWASDAVSEWLELGSLPEMLEIKPHLRDLLGPGRTIHLHATDTDPDACPDAAGEWLVDLTGDVPSWRPGHEKGAVALRGPLTELLLTLYHRRPLDDADVEVLGDEDLLREWLAANPFG